MSRLIRLYEKKRGHRRTGSKAVGNLGEALFFGTFFVLGCIALAAMIVIFVWPEWRVNRQFVQTDCVVLAKEVGISEADGAPPRYRPDITIRYEAGGKEYHSTAYDITRHYSENRQAVQQVVDSFDVGKTYPCWYDPLDPATAVIARGYSGWLYLLLLIPLSSMTIGGGRLILTLLNWNASEERRSLLAQRAERLDLFEVDVSDRQFPNVPADSNLTNSPGTTLAYRLPLATTAGWRLFAAVAASLVWNSVVAVFVIMAVRGYSRGEPDWTLIALVCPLAACGIALLVYTARLFLVTTGVGPTRIEISHHPLAPGGQYDIFLSQAGRMNMNSLEVLLACDERATFRQGTDTRTEARRVYQERCFLREGFEIHQGLPFESRCQVRVPADAMHSFQANHNEVSWKLIVKGNVVGWPGYQREFPIIVHPSTNGHQVR